MDNSCLLAYDAMPSVQRCHNKSLKKRHDNTARDEVRTTADTTPAQKQNCTVCSEDSINKHRVSSNILYEWLFLRTSQLLEKTTTRLSNAYPCVVPKQEISRSCESGCYHPQHHVMSTKSQISRESVYTETSQALHFQNINYQPSRISVIL